ncbi:MAG: PDZ domain-containing protein [Thermogutta sp.]|nr:PDZ domain-containing protein [Thermogutta sp.]
MSRVKVLKVFRSAAVITLLGAAWLSAGALRAEDDGSAKAGEYWLGVLCGPVPEALRAHLDLPEDTGLLVEEVVKEGPAEKAGLRVHDILLQAGDKSLQSPADLADEVNRAADKPLTLHVLRAGEKLELSVTPEPRPKGSLAPPIVGPDVDPKAWEKWFENFRLQPGQPPLMFRFFHPGTVMPPWRSPNLPEGMVIAITKSGDEPAKIVVKRGGKTWEATEDELDKLPAEVRPYVERLLSGRGWVERGWELPKVLRPTPDGVLKTPLGSLPGGESDRLRNAERRLDELQKRLERLERNLKKPAAEDRGAEAGDAEQHGAEAGA